MKKQMELRELYPYQKIALKWMNGKKKIPLFMEMRLGKTITAIRWAKQNNLKKVLIVCPLSIIYNWENELKLEGIPALILTQKQKSYIKLFSQLDEFWIITNYEKIRTDLFDDYKFDCVILDESAKIRRNGTQINKAIQEKFEDIEYKAILSGLPAPESDLDYFNQFKFLDGHFLEFETYNAFRYRFFYSNGRGKYIPTNYAKKAIKEYLKKNAFVVSRENVNIGGKKVYEKRYITLKKEVRQLYDGLEQNFELCGEMTNWIIVARNWLHQLCGGYPKKFEKITENHKIKEIIELLNTDLHNQQVIVWARYTKELKNIVLELRKVGYGANLIVGATPVEKRSQICEYFNDKKFQILVCQIKCGKYGLDLSKADTAIYYSNSWECEERTQSEDRIIHPNKTFPSLYIDLLVRNSIDEDIFYALQEKIKNANIFGLNIYKNFMKRVFNQTITTSMEEFENAIKKETTISL